MTTDTLHPSSINAFSVEPSEDTLITLTYGQLRDLITQAVEKAVQPLQDRLESLESTATGQGEEIAALRLEMAAQKTDYESMNLLRCDDFVIASRRITALQERLDGPSQGIGKTSKKRIEEVDKILRASPNGAAPFKLIRQKLGLAPNQFSRLISSLDKRKYQVTSHPSRAKEKILRAKVRWS
jgi:DNA-binding transcriptional regulator YiaG